MSEVRIVPDANGNVIRQSKNPDYGYVVIRQEKTSINKRGWINTSSRTALIQGTIDDLKKQKFRKNSKLPGSIYVLEQTEPFSYLMPERSLKYAGDTGIVCISADGEEIHRQTFYDPSGTTEDITIPHVNGAEIRNSKSSEAVEETEEAEEETTNEFGDLNNIDYSSAPNVSDEDIDDEEDEDEEVQCETDEIEEGEELEEELEDDEFQL